MDLRGVVEDDPSKVLGGVPPPLALLGPIAVASRLLLRGEADHGDAPAVFGDPRGGPEPAVGVGGELSLPAAQIPADPRWVGRSTLDDLNEHGPLSFSASVPSPGAVGRPQHGDPKLGDRRRHPYILLIRRYRVTSGTTLLAMMAPSPTAPASSKIFICQVSLCPHQRGDQ